MSFLNAENPLIFNAGDTADGVQINESWNTPTVTTALFHIESLSARPVTPVAPFDGATATVTQTASPSPLTIFQYAWPSALPEGTYRAYFTAQVSGKRFSTGDYLIVVKSA